MEPDACRFKSGQSRGCFEHVNSTLHTSHFLVICTHFFSMSLRHRLKFAVQRTFHSIHRHALMMWLFLLSAILTSSSCCLSSLLSSCSYSVFSFFFHYVGDKYPAHSRLVIGILIRGMILRINLVQNYSSKFGNSQLSLLSPTGGVKSIPPIQQNPT